MSNIQDVIAPGTGIDGQRTAEVVVVTEESNKFSFSTTMSKRVVDRYFNDEVFDETSHLGGFNIRYARSLGPDYGHRGLIRP